MTALASRAELTVAETFRQERRADLLYLAGLLEDKHLVADAGPLKAAANQLSKPSGVLEWRYRVTGLTFNLDLPANSLPAPIATGLTIVLNVTARGRVPCPAHDPFTELAIDIGLSASAPGGASHLCTWHLDRHITGGHVPVDLHPLYHFQYGGRGMVPVHGFLGQTLLLEAPRLIHPPLDAVLAVDFVLGHYGGAGRAVLLKDAGYRQRIREAQRRLWRPIDEALSRAWNADSDKATTGALSPAIILLEAMRD